MAFLIGIGVNAPTAMRLARLSQQMQGMDGARVTAALSEVKGLQAKLSRAGQISALLLVVAVAGMAVARYI